MAPAAPQAVLALQTLTNGWEGEAEVPSKENGRLWGTGKNKSPQNAQYGFHKSGTASCRGVLVTATNSFSTGTSSLLAAFPSLSLTPLQRDGL